jgi:hypothetical protein
VTHASTPSSPSGQPPIALDPRQLLAGLTSGGEETDGLSIAVDAHFELQSLIELVTTRGDAPVATLLQGLSRRLGAGIEILRKELAAKEPTS